MYTRRRLCLAWGAALLSALIGGCASYPGWIASAGPSGEQVGKAQQQLQSAIRLVDVDEDVASRVLAAESHPRFAEAFARPAALSPVVGPGDVIEVSIWEAPPALLLGSVMIDNRAGPSVSRGSALPEQMVAVDGSITVPFVGAVNVAGKSLHEVEAEIARGLSGKANQPQVLVRVTHNASANVTVVGEVAQSIRMPLTARGEHLLDAIAAAGGVRQPVGKMTVQITRGEQVKAMPLERVIQSPIENVALLPGDVVTLMFQPLSFTVLGATAKNEEISFEAQGISLAQALARAGGIQDARGDARGVFVFRFEDMQALAQAQREGPTTPDGRVPVVYRLDMKNPASFLVAQNFPIRNRDVVYVSNAPSSELQKFLNILTSSIFSAASLVNLGG